MDKKIEKSPDQKTMSNETIQIHRLCRLDIFHFLDRCEMERLYLSCKQIAVVLKTHFHMKSQIDHTFFREINFINFFVELISRKILFSGHHFVLSCPVYNQYTLQKLDVL